MTPLKGPRGPVGSSDRALRTTALEFGDRVMSSAQCAVAAEEQECLSLLGSQGRIHSKDD